MMTSEDFSRRTDPFRRELLVHCYRMLGSVHDAEDLVQETMLRAWRAFDQYDEKRASLRTWLYRIATNACLSALKKDSRRPLPSGMVAPGEDPTLPLKPGHEVSWLQPIPDEMLDPATVLASRGSLRLALIAAMQLLPARQRAILILREVLGLPAAEVAEMLETSTAAVNSGLQRARARLGDVTLAEDSLGEPSSARDREVLDRYVAAFEGADLEALKRLLADEAILEMPPFLNWYVGADAYTRFIARVFEMRGTDWKLLPAAANGQPAVAAYARADDGVYRLHTLQVFAVEGSRISRNVVFMDAEVFTLFGLAPQLS
ncbi:sigma-70 family RNA polymerase sigma factor [Nonomuraea sp. NPDC050536]|uniref:sigma-70 family RNA polymerase sigma factor n=1 Tax=Nonomuraea sp. NPDC050536 TaxID=3364366 RepID=UPI0037C8F9C4